MMRAPELAIKLGITAAEVFGFLYDLGYRNYTIHQVIPDRLALELERRIMESRAQKLDTLFSENNFMHVKTHIRHKDKPEIRSHFTDSEAINLCSRMSDGVIRSRARGCLKGQERANTSGLRYQFHYLAEKALDLYGGYILTFILRLRIFPGRQQAEIYRPITKRYNEYESTFPNLEFSDARTECYIRFFRQIEYPSRKVLTVFNSKHKPMFSITRSGILIDNYETRNVVLTIFALLQNGDVIFTSGHDNIYCDICGRELTDEVSIKYGRGPGCRNNFPL